MSVGGTEIHASAVRKETAGSFNFEQAI